MSQLLSFPNLPNIFWNVSKNGVLKLDLSFDKLSSLVENKKIYFLFQNSSLLETTYCALILELYKKIFPYNQLFWNGPRMFSSIFRLQNLASYAIMPNNFELTFPTPIHKTEDSVFFNLLYHYPSNKNLEGQFTKSKQMFCGNQILKHSLLPSSEEQLILRSNFSTESQKLKSQIDPKKKIILFLPFKNSFSHVEHSYGYGSRQILELAKRCEGQYQIVVLHDDKSQIIPHSNILYFQFSFDLFFSLLTQTKALFSAMVDFHHIVAALKLPIHHFYYHTKLFYNPALIKGMMKSFSGSPNVFNPDEILKILKEKNGN